MSSNTDTPSNSTPNSKQRRLDPVRLGTLLERGEQLYATRLAECFRARTRESGQDVLFWTFRHPFPADSRGPVRFLERVEMFQHSSPSTPTILTSGIDENGIGFVVMDYVEGRPLLSLDEPDPDAQDLFLVVTELVADLHRKGLVLGDFGEGSFLVDAQGKIRLIGILGDLKLDAKKTSSLAPAASIYFCSPEQRDGTNPSPTSDIYSLGVISYRLFTGTYPVSSDTVMHQMGTSGATLLSRSPSSVCDGVPSWVDAVVTRCLERDLNRRYADGSTLLEDLARQRGMGSEREEFRERSRQYASEHTDIRESVDRLDSRHESRQRGASASKKKTGEGLILAGMIAFFVVVFLSLGTYFFSDRKPETSDPSKKDPLALQERFATEAIIPLLREIRNPASPLEAREKATLELGKISDPLVFESLVTILNGGAPEPGTRELQSAALKSFLGRLEDAGMLKSVQVLGTYVSGFLQQGGDIRRSPVIYHAWRACEPTGDTQVRLGALEQVRLLDSRFGLQLGASMLFSDNKPEGITEVFRSWLAQEFPGEDISRVSTEALVLTSPSLVDIFDELKDDFVHRMKNEELSWALAKSIRFDSSALLLLAQEAQTRNLFDRYHNVFLSVLTDAGRFGASKVVQRALVRGALGELAEHDSARFAEWNNPDVARVFLAGCVISPNSAEALDIFDTLAARNLEQEPAKSLVTWVKAHHWDQREKLVKTVGVLGLYRDALPEDVDEAFQALRPYVNDSSFIEAVMAAQDSTFLMLTVEHLASVLSNDQLLSLLGHSDKFVRIAAVQALRRTNELTALQRIGRAYDRETDPDVRLVYEKTHWFTSQH